MFFQMLGGIEVHNNGARLDIGGVRQRRLLCSLVVARGTVVSVDRLVEQLWDDNNRPTRPESAVRTCVTRLRRALGGGTEVVVTRAPGYLLEVGDHEVDAARFKELIESAPAADDPRVAEARLREALGLWRGPAFEEFADLEWCRAEAERLGALRLVGIEKLHRVRLESGGTLELVPDLERDCAAYPFHEPLRILLMEALWRAGRSTHALRAAHSYRQYLAEQTGLEPSSEFAQLEASVLSGASPPEPSDAPPAMQRPPIFVTHPDLTVVDVPVAAVTGRPGNLPSRASSFVGREGELILLAGLLEEQRVVTLVGTAGVGKTRTAIEVATGVSETFVDGCWLVELAPVPAGRTVWDPITVGLRALLPLARSFDEVIEGLRDRRALIVLDNCEHVIASSAEAARRIAENCPYCVVLCTSRQALDIADEVVLDLDPLPAGAHGDQLSDAARLLVDRAGESRLPLDERTESGQVEAVAARLGGVPLAIELAAARLRTMTLNELHQGLDRQPSLLERRDGGDGHRHSSLSAAIDWSYQLLSSADQQLLCDLSVFAGPFTESDALTVVDSGPTVAEGIRRLVEHSLLQRSVADGHSTFALLDSIRQFASDELADGERVAPERRHAEHYLDLAQHSLSATSNTVPRERLDPLLIELRAALERSSRSDDRGLWTRLHRALLQAAQQCGRHDLEKGASHSALAIAELALDSADIDIELLEIGARAAMLVGQSDTAIDYAERWLQAAREDPDPDLRIDPLYLLGKVSCFRRDLDRARQAINELEALAATLGSDTAQATAYASLANLCSIMLDDHERAIRAADAAILHARAAGNDGLRAQALIEKGSTVLGFDPGTGRALVEEGIRLAERTGERLLVSRGFWNLADATDNPIELDRLIGQVDAAAVASGFHSMVVDGGPWLRTLAAMGHADRSSMQQHLSKPTGTYNRALTTALKCHLALESGDAIAAERFVAELEAKRKEGAAEDILYLFIGLRLAGFQGDLAAAEDLAADLPALVDQRLLAYVSLTWTLEELDRAGASHLLLASTADAMAGIDSFQCRYLHAWTEEARDKATAEAAYRTALDNAERESNSNYAASAHMALGRLAAESGQHERAERHLSAALAQLEQWPGRRRDYAQGLLELAQNQRL